MSLFPSLQAASPTPLLQLASPPHLFPSQQLHRTTLRLLSIVSIHPRYTSAFKIFLRACLQSHASSSSRKQMKYVQVQVEKTLENCESMSCSTTGTIRVRGSEFDLTAGWPTRAVRSTCACEWLVLTPPSPSLRFLVQLRCHSIRPRPAPVAAAAALGAFVASK